MEENSEKNVSNESDFEDFKDFDDEEMTRPEIEAEEINEFVPPEEPQSEHEEDLLKEAEAIAKLTQETGFAAAPEDNPDAQQSSEEETQNSEVSETKDNEETEETEAITPKDEQAEVKEAELPPEPNQWEELSEDNGVVKKYIFYISKDFVPLIDSMTPDERTGYINDAIQKKVDIEYEYSLVDRKKRILTHVITMILTFFVVTPIILFLVHKSIMMTFENYKYSQDNFERLYKQRFEKDRAYMRSIEYNKLHNKDKKKENNK